MSNSTKLILFLFVVIILSFTGILAADAVMGGLR